MGEDDFLPPLIEVLESEGTFGHRQHLCLAWRYLRTADEATAERLMRAAIRHVAALHGTPDRYHETLTIAWTRLVAAHVRADGLASFEEFIAENRELLDRRLPDRHFSTETLWAERARRKWVEPDLIPLPARRR